MRRLTRKLNAAVQRVFSPMGFAYSFTIIVVVSVVLSIFAIQYANYVDGKSNHQWCRIIILIDDRNKSVTITPDNKDFVQEMARLRRDFKCDDD